jgi:hypothetical protein
LATYSAAQIQGEGGGAVASPNLANSIVGSALPQAPSSPEGLAWSATLNVFVPKPSDVTAYLDQHGDLARLLPEICAQVRQAFGQETELSLEVYRDPEIDDCYLTLYVRQDEYDARIIERIEAVRSGFHDSVSAISGHLLLATDLRRPRGLHAV